MNDYWKFYWTGYAFTVLAIAGPVFFWGGEVGKRVMRSACHE